MTKTVEIPIALEITIEGARPVVAEEYEDEMGHIDKGTPLSTLTLLMGFDSYRWPSYIQRTEDLTEDHLMVWANDEGEWVDTRPRPSLDYHLECPNSVVLKRK